MHKRIYHTFQALIFLHYDISNDSKKAIAYYEQALIILREVYGAKDFLPVPFFPSLTRELTFFFSYGKKQLPVKRKIGEEKIENVEVFVLARLKGE